MQRVRFIDPADSIRVGEWTDDGIVFGDERYSPDEVRILPPTEPSKIVCVGLNYADHAEEEGLEVPDRPMFFLKPPRAVAGHGSTVTLPRGKQNVEFEAELGVVIEEQCRNVAAEDAMDVVAGFTCVNDVSNRDDQRVEQNWVRGKAFDGSAPLGPVVAPPEDVPDDASLELRLNGEVRQQSSRDQLIFSVPELIEEVTRHLTLDPGDVISTGTTSGVGQLSDGDTVAIDVEGIRTLEHTVRAP